jgi:long-chain acyl-CoA synthetase
LPLIERAKELIQIRADYPFILDAITDRTFTYAESDRIARNLALGLRARGIAHGDRVLLLMPNGAEFALLYFACLYTGAVAVPVNPMLHPREMAFITAHAGARLLVYAPETQNLAGNIDLPTWEITPEEAAAPRETPGDWQPFDGVSPDALFSITFTSGTTSLPKGVAHRVGGLLENAAAFNRLLGFGPEHRYLHVLPMAYMAGFLNTLLCPFMAGGSVVIAPPFDARSALRFWKPVIQYEANTFWLVPTMLTSLNRIDRDPAGPVYCREHVRTICVGTAPLPRLIRQDFEEKYGVALFESYGLSELLLVSGQASAFPYKAGSVGRLIEGAEARILDEAGQPVAPGIDGDIAIQTPYVMAGYLDYETLQPDQVERDGWFSTGDIGHLDADGNLFITGRKKDLIIRGGTNVSPRAVEEVLLLHPSVAQVAVIGLPHPFYGEEVVAVLQLKVDYNLDGERSALQTLCQENLSAAAVPTRWVVREALPTNPNGKIQKNKLREQLSE